jgi:hypothetical protein
MPRKSQALPPEAGSLNRDPFWLVGQIVGGVAGICVFFGLIYAMGHLSIKGGGPGGSVHQLFAFAIGSIAGFAVWVFSWLLPNRREWRIPRCIVLFSALLIPVLTVATWSGWWG